MSGQLLLTFNPGSSSIKIGLFIARDGVAQRIGKGQVDLQQRPLTLTIESTTREHILLEAGITEDLHEVLDEVLRWLGTHFPLQKLGLVGHRVVHGGDIFAGPVGIDEANLAAIAGLVTLAPLHQPQSLRLIRAIRHLRPGLRQTASFDTAFHRTQSEMIRRFAIPRHLHDKGIKRYGFHGLSYTYIAQALQQRAPDVAAGRVVVAHLGSGASLCALRGGLSQDSSMGFSTLDGIPMSTRCGALDPGVLLHLLDDHRMMPAQLEDMLYHSCGLLGLSGISGDSRVLLASEAPEAREAIAVFAFRVAREIAALTNTLGGLDAIVFTAGIGEHQPEIRQAICDHLGWLGVSLDAGANAAGQPRLEAAGSTVAVLVLATDEEQVIADDALYILNHEMSAP
ncbi:acetate kinase [Humitalea rosea]|uniref:Acetate kinase n=1 Tax=Humitalea rosea TaxID=990373 RepID=A0A2W7HXF1_9PROT|nr:acetate/propionate family kinase [Humitalea rosea]PZW39331.1 acetate kinase [Humitalea rosea]